MTRRHIFLWFKPQYSAILTTNYRIPRIKMRCTIIHQPCCKAEHYGALPSSSGLFTLTWEQTKGMPALFSPENRFFCTGEIEEKTENQQFCSISWQVLRLISLKINIQYFPLKDPNHKLFSQLSKEQRFQLHHVYEFRFEWWTESAWPLVGLFFLN